MENNSIDEIIKINPDVIFLDEWFHGMRGNEICTILRSINQLKRTQIFLISAVTSLKDIALKCSADGYVEKPFSLSDIVDILSS